MTITKHYTFEELKRENPKQTAVIVGYRGPKGESWTRVILGKWYTREDAWSWCQSNDIRRYQEEQGMVIDSIRLLRLSKVVKDFEERKPKRTSAVAV